MLPKLKWKQHKISVGNIKKLKGPSIKQFLKKKLTLIYIQIKYDPFTKDNKRFNKNSDGKIELII